MKIGMNRKVIRNQMKSWSKNNEKEEQVTRTNVTMFFNQTDKKT